MARIGVRLAPGAGRDAIEGWIGEELRVRVASPPVEGAANKALVRLLAKALGIAPTRLAIVHGALGRSKVIDVEGLSDADVRARLAAFGDK